MMPGLDCNDPVSSTAADGEPLDALLAPKKPAYGGTSPRLLKVGVPLARWIARVTALTCFFPAL